MRRFYNYVDQLKELPIFCYCRLQELKVQEQFWVHINGILRNWKILPAPFEKNLPLPISQRVYLSHTKCSRIKM